MESVPCVPATTVATSIGTAPFGNLLVVAKTQSLQSKRDEYIVQIGCQSDWQLLELMVRDQAPDRVVDAASLEAVYAILRSYPSVGPFLAFQFAIDLNYTATVNFSEMDFVVAGPGAQDGIRRCFRRHCRP